MKKEFAIRKIALALKELEFGGKCFGRYWIKEFQLRSPKNYNSSNEKIDSVSAPLWQQAWSFLDGKGVIIGIIFVDDVFKYTLNTKDYVSNGFKDRMSAIESATKYATDYLWNQKFNK